MTNKADVLSDRRIANKAQAAAFFNVSLPTIEAWIRRGAPVRRQGSRGSSWELDLLELAEWHFGGAKAEDELDPDTMSPQDRKAWYDSEMKKRELQEKDRELVPTSEVEEVVATAFAAIAQDIWAIPDKLERSHGVSATVAAQVERGLSLALDGLVERLSKLASVGTPELEGAQA